MARIANLARNWVVMENFVLVEGNAKEVVHEKATVNANVTVVLPAKLVINVLKDSTKMRLAKTTIWSVNLATRHVLTSAPVLVQPSVWLANLDFLWTLNTAVRTTMNAQRPKRLKSRFAPRTSFALIQKAATDASHVTYPAPAALVTDLMLAKNVLKATSKTVMSA